MIVYLLIYQYLKALCKINPCAEGPPYWKNKALGIPITSEKTASIESILADAKVIS